MAERVVDAFGLGDLVEIRFASDAPDEWQGGRIVGHQSPGVWVELNDGSKWFVTNRRRIRGRRPAYPGTSAP
jgi:hypothetical protein